MDYPNITIPMITIIAVRTIAITEKSNIKVLSSFYNIHLSTWCWWGFCWIGKHCGCYCYGRKLGCYTDHQCIGCSSVRCQGYFHVCAVADYSHYCCINRIDNFTNSYFWVELTLFGFCTFWFMFESNFFFSVCKHCTSSIAPASIQTYITVPHCKVSS